MKITDKMRLDFLNEQSSMDYKPDLESRTKKNPYPGVWWFSNYKSYHANNVREAIDAAIRASRRSES